MDFLDFEEETQIDESDSPHQSVSKLLDDKELLSEVRATPRPPRDGARAAQKHPGATGFAQPEREAQERP